MRTVDGRKLCFFLKIYLTMACVSCFANIQIHTKGTVRPIFDTKDHLQKTTKQHVSNERLRHNSRRLLLKVYLVCVVSAVLTVALTAVDIVLDSISIIQCDTSSLVLQSNTKKIQTYLGLLKYMGTTLLHERILNDSVVQNSIVSAMKSTEHYLSEYCSAHDVFDTILCNSPSKLNATDIQNIQFLKESVFENGFSVIITKTLRETNDIKIADISNYLKYKATVESCYFLLMDVIECGLATIDPARSVLGRTYHQVKLVYLNSVDNIGYNNSILSLVCLDISNTDEFSSFVSYVLFVTNDMQSRMHHHEHNLLASFSEQKAFHVTRIVCICILSFFVFVLLFIVVGTVKTFKKGIYSFAEELSDKTMLLEKEKQMTEEILFQMIPKSVVSHLKTRRGVCAETFESVTVFFSDVVGFTSISAKIEPMKVVELLNTIYSIFDVRIETYDVYKVETIGDAYMVASGVPNRNGQKHVGEIATMAIDLLAAVKQVALPKSVGKGHIQIRVGIHTGSCVAGVVGIKMPRYCLFGDTVNTASRMESSGLPMKIHCSHPTYESLHEIGGFSFVPRGEIDIKGKGKMVTYWLKGRDDMDEFNDSMVCKFVPKKKRTGTLLTDSSSTLISKSHSSTTDVNPMEDLIV